MVLAATVVAILGMGPVFATAAEPLPATESGLPFEPPVPESTPAPPYSEQQLVRFLAAYAEVEEIRATYVLRLKRASTSDEARELAERGRREMRQAIERNGLDVTTYLRIAQRANHDPELRKKLEKLIDEAQRV